jgi:serine/threonine-protein kinase
MSVIVDGAAKGIANGNGLDTPLPAGLHTIIARKNSLALVSKIASGSERLLSVTFENAPTPGSLTILTDVDGVSFKLLHGTTTIHEGTSAAGKLDMADLPIGSYILQAKTSASAPANEQKLVITQGQNTTVSFHFKQKPALIPLRVRTSPGASILVDGKEAGTTGTNGVLLVSSLPAGSHRIEARRHGKAAVLDVNLVEGEDKAHVAELKLDAGEGTVSLQLNPANSDVTVYAANGKQVPVTGAHFDLPEGRYHFIARANGYIDRAEAVDVTAESSIPVNLVLSPITMDKAAPSITGWQSASWAIDAQNHTLVHSGPDISLYSAQSGHGRYMFSGSVGHAFLFSKPKVEWVAGYRDSNNYLLFSLDRTGLELFTIKAGKRLPNGNRIIFSQISKYQILFQVLPGHITTSLGDGHQWKLLSDWTGLPEDVDTGRFGFKGPVTLNSFSHTP